jgi:anhydro-N-acetylmuramic acid kinase
LDVYGLWLGVARQDDVGTVVVEPRCGSSCPSPPGCQHSNTCSRSSNIRGGFERASSSAPARGEVHEGLLRSLLAEPYYGLGPPKSTGKELFNLPYLLERLEPFGDIEADDLVATVTALTSRTVADALQSYDVPEVVASGGGTSNPTLMGMLQEDAKEVRLRTIEDWGIPSDAKEAYAFALMGFLSVHGLPSNVPSCTGARSAVVLGSITPGRSPLVLPDPVPRAPGHLRIED